MRDGLSNTIAQFGPVGAIVLPTAMTMAPDNFPLIGTLFIASIWAIWWTCFGETVLATRLRFHTRLALCSFAIALFVSCTYERLLVVMGSSPAAYHLVLFVESFATPTFWAFMALVIGLLAGASIAVHALSRVGGRPWVNRWLTPAVAFSEFSPRELSAAIKAAEEQIRWLEVRKRAAAARLDEANEPDRENRFQELQSVEAELASQKGAVGRLQTEIVNDIRGQLKYGVLSARGLEVIDGKVSTRQVLLPPALWSVLDFVNPGSPDRVRGAGREYRGIEIGKGY